MVRSCGWTVPIFPKETSSRLRRLSALMLFHCYQEENKGSGGRAVAEDHAGRFDPELRSEGGRCVVTQLVRVPLRHARLLAGVLDRPPVRGGVVALGRRGAPQLRESSGLRQARNPPRSTR